MIGKKTQLIHDYNAALYYFIKKNKLDESVLKIACRKFSKEKTGKKPFTNINLVKI